MKNKGIAIELTALLDVILIMLFWVMLSLEKQNETVKAEAAEQIAEYSQLADEANAERDIIQKQFDRYIAAMSDSAAAANQKALDDFAEGRMITLNLSYDAVGKLFIFDENGEIGHTLIGSSDEIAGSIRGVLEASGLKKADVILCALVYDGSRALYRDVKTITAAADEVGGEYDNFYCTYINISR